ncbi:hypothetical protein PENANT_c007G09658 [Penicillium antarcticum]|uniref:Amidase domain-containing protein n=1 Tax=Penicillium antarcticum TaxID=416450 RepID=A0A1V6QBR6_9EURO|nr:hypothetical protein PENANT_c007G09658 [Penicillium antarcticum]
MGHYFSITFPQSLRNCFFEEAQQSDDYRASEQLSRPLEGIPFTVKDSFVIKGMTVAAGSSAFTDLINSENAAVFSLNEYSKAPTMMASVPVLSASKTDEYQFNCKTLSREVRLYRTMHPSARPNHLVADSLFTSNKLLTDPYFFIPTSQDQHRVIATCYMVFHLCGHVGYVHGGMTASMNDDFQIPSIPDRADVYHAEITRTEGRKAGVTGQIRCVKELTAI